MHRAIEIAIEMPILKVHEQWILRGRQFLTFSVKKAKIGFRAYFQIKVSLEKALHFKIDFHIFELKVHK